MSLTIPANDFAQIRVFSLAVRPSPALRDREPDALAEAFGTNALNPDFVDVVDLSALDEFGLTGLLEQGYGLVPDAADKLALKALSGWAILVMSRATSGREVTLSPIDGLSHVTTLGDKATLQVREPLESEAAKGVLEPASNKPAKSDARMSGMVAMAALLVMFLLVGLMVWVGG